MASSFALRSFRQPSPGTLPRSSVRIARAPGRTAVAARCGPELWAVRATSQTDSPEAEEDLPEATAPEPGQRLRPEAPLHLHPVRPETAFGPVV